MLKRDNKSLDLAGKSLMHNYRLMIFRMEETEDYSRPSM